MNNKEAIINKIIQDAEIEAQANIDTAKKQAQDIIDQANAKADKLRQANAKKPEELAKEVIDRRKSVSELDCRKLTLKAKKEIIDGIFDDAISSFRVDKQSKYVDYIAKVIEANAEDGDEVIISKEDAKIFDKKFVDSLSKKIGKKLVLSKEFGKFKGGIILSNSHFDKNLTLDLDLATLREKIEAQLDEILFKESK